MKKKELISKIGLFTLVMITSSIVVSIRNLPTIAEMGLKMIFFGLVAMIFYFIPAGLVSAELATGWPKQGGIYVWVKEALGKKWGFFAIWLQWTYMIWSMIAMLYFISGSLAFVLAPSLAQNRIFLIVMSLIVIWTFTLLNMKGLKITGIISSICFLGGVLFPAVLVITLGIIYVSMGNPINLDLSLTASNILPNFKDITTLVLLIGFMRAFAGIEVSATHANSVKKPMVNYPIAIIIVVCLGFLVNVLGSMSVAVVVPQKEISLIAGVMEAFVAFLSQFKIGWFIHILGILVAMGQMGGVSAWMMGPVKGLLSTAQEGDLPRFFHKTNKYNVPSNLLIVQAIVISCAATILLMMPSINNAFWVSVAVSMMIYVSMYFLMFVSGIYLRYKSPNVKRKFKIPGKNNIGMWILGSFGAISMVCSFIIAFFPPAQLPTTHVFLFESIIIGSAIVIFTLPFIIRLFKKPDWVIKGEKAKIAKK